MGEEEHFYGDRQARVEEDNNDEQHLARSHVGCAEHRVQIPDEEEGRLRQTQADEDIVENWRALAKRNFFEGATNC
jgi:hypothetical protein